MTATAETPTDVSYRIRIAKTIADIPSEIWNTFGGAARGTALPYNPFISHAFLSALEKSGSATAETGWLGQHLVLEDDAGRILGVMPCYLKSHSQGEYVFDHAWADAWHRAGGRYYPKLQCSIPFTPATSPRMLLAPGVGDGARMAFAAGLKQLTETNGLSSAHVTFTANADLETLLASGFMHRVDQQFHFENQGYGCYDDFLETLASRKRKNLKKERATALENGVTIEWLTGSDITEAVLDTFFVFYTDTGDRKWGRPYLTRDFYSLVVEGMRDDILLVMAKRNGRYVAGAINFIGETALYGRHWGCIEQHPMLHFEVCYHQAIDFAIARGLTMVEAGAQGEHKLARGYLPVTTHSAHFIPHDGFRRAIADYLAHEREEVSRFGEILKEAGPFRKTS